MASEGSGDVFAPEGGTPAWSADDWSGTTENQPTHSEQSDQHSEDVPTSVDQVPHPSDNVSNDEEEDEGAEYDPESVTITTVSAPVVERLVSNSPRPSKKPKTAGGFIVGSSDDEDDTPTPAPAYTNTLKPTPSDTQVHPLTHTPLQQDTTPKDTSSYSPAREADGLAAQAIASNTATPTAAATATRSRLPTDIVGILEDRIKEDPRGDLEAWLTLIDEHKRRHKIEDARSAYERFLKVFPQSAEIWVAYVDMELSLNNHNQAEGIFTRTLMKVPSVQLWTSYLNYVRRRNDLNDPTGQARQTVSRSYEFVLNTIGQDRDSGVLWQDYIQFIKTGPGQIGGSGWQDQQKMDILRKAYQRAISIPMANLNSLWKEYDQFEMALNKMTGRKFLQERSPSYMTARSANTHLDNITRGIRRTTLPRLPPAPGFEGDQEYLEQVALWKAWIAWEKDDPLVLKADDLELYRLRVLHVYKQALMALRFWPEMWVDAADWCFENNIISKDGQDIGLQFLLDGVEANPESPVLALKHADRIESTQPAREDDAGKAALVQALKRPFDTALDSLYSMTEALKQRRAEVIATIGGEVSPAAPTTENADMDEEDEGEIKEKLSTDIAKQSKVKAILDGIEVQMQMLSQHISYLWIALARVFRRIQGQGFARSKPPVGIRGIFTEARVKGRLITDVYIEIARMEWNVYQDNVATKIFERGARLFPEDEEYFVEYLKHLHARRDFTNARVVFSQTVQRFKASPELIPKLRPIYAYFHSYEARFGELAQIRDLEKQMAELFPEDPSLSRFAARFSTETYNPVAARVIISPVRQMRPKVIQSVEHASISTRSTPHPMPQIERSPQPQYLPVANSPKRPFQADDQDDYPPRKLARGASPLKGAAGRRLDQQRRAQQGQGASSYASAPAPIPRDITFLLGLIPPSEAFRGHQFNTDGMVRLIRETPVPSFSDWRAQRDGNALTRAQTRHASSSEYPTYAYSSRDSPGPRPASPFSGINRGIAQSAPYRNSPLRPGSSGSYEPPPAVYQVPTTGQFNPSASNPAAENAGYAAWQGGYAPPSQYNTSTNQQQPQQYGSGYY
ncbi:mRNA 3'-end-processing protein rna14 [Parahypoxylon ruwenzoriense]